VDVAPERTAAETNAASRRARQRRSSLLSGVDEAQSTLGSDTTLGA
jgi:hypothetical protein